MSDPVKAVEAIELWQAMEWKRQRDDLRKALAALRDDLSRRHDEKLHGSKNYLGEIPRARDQEEIEHMAKLLIKADYALANLNKTDGE